MLPKDKRLNLQKDFQWAVSGKKLETKYLKLFIKRGDNDIPKVGIATSGKIFRKATQRNRARRVTSGALELIYNRLSKYINILALPKAGIINVKSKDVLSDLEDKLKKTHVI